MPSYSRLTESKRYTIETLHRKRTPQIKIAEILDVHPSTISRELRRLGPSCSYSHRQAHRDQKSGGDLHHFLRHPAKSYRDRSAGKERRGRIKNQVMIDHRPPIVEERTRIGDWEMDTVIGRTGGPVLVTMVERRSRFTLIRLVPSKEVAVVTAAILEATTPYRDKILSHTYDNGKELSLIHISEPTRPY